MIIPHRNRIFLKFLIKFQFLELIINKFKHNLKKNYAFTYLFPKTGKGDPLI